MNNDNNFSAIFGFIVFVLFFGVVFGWEACTASERHSNAEDLANRWLNDVYGEEARNAGVSCQATDSDGNGYVTCTVMIHHEDDENELVPIECASYVLYNLGDTCRPLIPVGLRPRR